MLINNKHTKRLLYAFLLLLTISCRDEVGDLSNELDKALDNKAFYERNKEGEINKLRSLLSLCELSPQQEYDINYKLYNAFRKYRLDSAILYTKRNLEIAKELKDKRRILESSIRLAPLHSYLGQYRESEAILNSLKREEIPNDLLGDYFESYYKLFNHYGSITFQPSYSHLSNIYKDSMLMYNDSNSFRYKISLCYDYLSKEKLDEAEVLLNELYDNCEENAEQYAEITYTFGKLHAFKGNKELEKKYYYKSAIADVKNSIKENASFQTLALLLNNEGDIDGAIKYTQLAIEDAMFSNIQYRSVQMYKFYTFTNASYQAKIAKSKSIMQSYVLVISVLTIFLIILFIYSYRQMRRIAIVKEQVSNINEKLRSLNEELNEKNAELQESNTIKEQYIAQFFDLCSGYIEKFDTYRQSLNRLAMNRQYEELYKRLKSTSVIDDEIDDLYRNFDSIFLSIYPTFVSDFNSLLEPDEQIQLKSDDMLNRELRIYALLRLGINNGVKIASFLRCSLSTVYNYRTKARNRAATSREDFELQVMKIGNFSKK